MMARLCFVRYTLWGNLVTYLIVLVVLGWILGCYQIRHESTRLESAELFSRKKCKARTVVGGEGGAEEPAIWSRV